MALSWPTDSLSLLRVFNNAASGLLAGLSAVLRPLFVHARFCLPSYEPVASHKPNNSLAGASALPSHSAASSSRCRKWMYLGDQRLQSYIHDGMVASCSTA